KRGSFQPAGSACPESSRKRAYSRRVTGLTPILNASSHTRCRGLSQRKRPSEPIQNQPSGITTILGQRDMGNSFLLSEFSYFSGCNRRSLELPFSHRKQ